MTSESLTQWRKRLGDDLFQQILVETISLGLEEKVIDPKELSEVISGKVYSLHEPDTSCIVGWLFYDQLETKTQPDNYGWV